MTAPLYVHPSTDSNEPSLNGNRGILLRDYFATAALTATLANPKFVEHRVALRVTPEENAEWHADLAYKLADAMLARRES